MAEKAKKGILKVKQNYEYVIVHPETEPSQVVDFAEGVENLIASNIDKIPVATAERDGLMTKEDKKKLDGIDRVEDLVEQTRLKGNAETEYRTNNVNLTPENIDPIFQRFTQSVSDVGPDESMLFSITNNLRINHTVNTMYTQKLHNQDIGRKIIKKYYDAPDTYDAVKDPELREFIKNNYYNWNRPWNSYRYMDITDQFMENTYLRITPNLSIQDIPSSYRKIHTVSPYDIVYAVLPSSVTVGIGDAILLFFNNRFHIMLKKTFTTTKKELAAYQDETNGVTIDTFGGLLNDTRNILTNIYREKHIEVPICVMEKYCYYLAQYLEYRVINILKAKEFILPDTYLFMNTLMLAMLNRTTPWTPDETNNVAATMGNPPNSKPLWYKGISIKESTDETPIQVQLICTTPVYII